MTIRPGDKRNVSAAHNDLRDKIAQEALLDDEPLAVEEETPPEEKPETPTAEPSLSPAQRWKTRLDAAKMTEAEANTILDAFVSPGFYQKDVVLMGGRVRATLRTREAENMQRILRATDTLRNPTQLALNQTVTLYNLAGSLCKYAVRGKPEIVLKFPKHGDTPVEAATMFDTRLDFILSEIPAPVLDQLFAHLFDFDRRVAAALSEGAVEGF